MSPELLVPDKFSLEGGRPTKASDCYALGMVIYEVLSGQKPFIQYSNLPVVWRILEGERPERPQGEQGVWFTDDIWGISERCWKSQPSDRISAKTVLRDLERIPAFDMDRTVITSDQLKGTIRAAADEQLVTTVGDSSTFSPFTEGLRLTFNHSWGITDKIMETAISEQSTP